MHESAQILVRSGVDHKTFREEILSSHQPVVMRGLVSAWPAVGAGRESARLLGDYIRRFDRGKPVHVMQGPPSIRGHFFYRDDLRGLNFEREPAHIGATIERLLGHLSDAQPPAIYIESTPTPDYLPGFAAANALPLLDASVAPRIWIGNTLTVQTHFDLSENIACVVGGRRRFTLFPPDQLSNLYVGPFDFTLSGPPVSMVPLKSPDLARYPRFAAALAASQTAELGPGDALYIPYGWWHHVESLEPFNVLVNYWWNEARPGARPFDCLLHATLALRDLPPEQLAVWKGIFDHYVFQSHGEAMGHLTPEQRGLLGPQRPERTQAIRDILARSFTRS